MVFAQQHPDRIVLHNEVHARPYDPVYAPCTVLHWVYDTTGIDAADIVSHMANLMRANHLPQPGLSSNQVTVTLPNFTLRWERHTEFVTFTAWQVPVGKPVQEHMHASTFSLTSLQAALPHDWLKQACGRLLSAVELRLELAPSQSSASLSHSANAILSSIANSCVTVQTDFQLMGNGFSQWRVYVHDAQSMSEQRLGRLVQQLLEIETYRMMALLGLPAARAVGALLNGLEQDLAAISVAIDTADKSQEPALLERLTRQASQVEGLFAMHHARFSATSAYMGLVEQRLQDLNEQRIDEFPTIAMFLSRRLTPAAQTCAWAAKRLQAMSQRVSRSSNLLRTRVEIEQQAHHQLLLSTMTERQLSQIRLQSTVEGLSAVAISYYAAGIVGYLCKAVLPYGWFMSVELTTALSIPVVLVAVLWGLHRIKKNISVQ